jgi:riboflavin kinase / FMN adenylyltransferase
VANVRVWHSVDEIPRDLAGSVVTIGVFDGVHRGHHGVVRRAARHAAQLGLPLVVVTFDPHPLTVVRPEHAPPLVSTVSHRIRLLADAGADCVLVLRFDAERARQGAEEFVQEIVVGALHARMVVVGDDFRFGQRAAGDVHLLHQLGPRLGFTVDTVEPISDPGRHRWSSTYIRDRIASGDVDEAWRALGHPFQVEGVVVRGDRRGKALGYPTANVPPTEGFVVPADGVYAGWLSRLDELDAPRMPAAISVGTNPTFHGTTRRVEGHVLDRDDLELYDVPVAIQFAARLRGMERFESVEELVAQMGKDVDAAREIVGGVEGESANDPPNDPANDHGVDVPSPPGKRTTSP